MREKSETVFDKKINRKPIMMENLAAFAPKFGLLFGWVFLIL